MEQLDGLKNITNTVDLAVDLKKLKGNFKIKRLYNNKKVNNDHNHNKQNIVKLTKIPSNFFINTNMSAERYNFLINLLKRALKKDSIQKSPIELSRNLILTLNYLSCGPSFQSLAQTYKLNKNTIKTIILDTCEIIWKTLSPFYVSEPTNHDLELISNDFLSIWGIPNCIGCIDGKHIQIVRPRNSGTQYLNDKGFCSIVLVAVCDAKHIFTYIDLGMTGGQNTYQKSNFGKKLYDKMLPLPEPKNLPDTSISTSHFFVTNAPFPLSSNIMKPYTGMSLSKKKNNFNKKISTIQNITKNSLEILTFRWRILLNRFNMGPKNVEKIVLACIALHNFIMLNDDNRKEYCPKNFIDWIDNKGVEHLGEWRQRKESLHGIQSTQLSDEYDEKDAINMRDEISEYLYKSKPLYIF